MSADAVAAGAAAWQRLCKRERASWQDWLTVSRALIVGRTATMKAANTNRAIGTTYNRLMGEWLRSNSLSGISAQERHRALQVLERLDEIESWRESLSEAKRRTLNHPSAVWHAWKRFLAEREQTSAGQEQHVQRVSGAAKRGRPVHWPQDALRRAHEAMLNSRSTDLLTLARLALTAAIRNSDDLVALFPADAADMPAPPAQKNGHASAA